ncbi:hypothetical protein T4A_4437 [Trichinella pseudospiralis]|uniref:Uncharacterized protein n=1 Tax=Trichinella pseudospiralis TaxID=6337 RepID=A0A0V1AQH8_TRIPS|nr:hypothetical protein T4A_4437 [Trichinella pseudospiralis]
MDHNRTHSSALEHHRESRPATRCNQCVCHLAPPVITKTIKQQNHAGEGNSNNEQYVPSHSTQSFASDYANLQE